MCKSKRKNKIAFFAIISFMFVISVIDNLLTYIGSPDLSKESNPLVHTLGFSWAGLLAMNVILYALDVFMAYYVFIGYEPKIVACNSKKEYMSMMLFDRPDKYIWTWYKLPNNKDGYRFMLACFRFVIVLITPLLRLKASIEWCVYLLRPELFNRYCDFLGKVAVTTVWGRGDLIIQVCILIVILMFVFTNIQYKANQKLADEH
ncbi:MAG: hypothetical protein IJ433_08325 [Ruminococcus sp.]|nr:hypothetical protein [Ruminococcus sp.]